MSIGIFTYSFSFLPFTLAALVRTTRCSLAIAIMFGAEKFISYFAALFVRRA